MIFKTVKWGSVIGAIAIILAQVLGGEEQLAASVCAHYGTHTHEGQQ